MDYVEQRMAEEAAKQQGATGPSFLTPLNLLLLGLVLYTAYIMLRSNPPASLPKQDPAIVFRTYTPRTLLENNGENGKPIYLAIRGRVFDVSSRPQFYGPGSSYSNFAGRDASRGLACGSFDEEMLTKDLDGPLDTLSGLGASEMETLADWEASFGSKYPIVGKLVSAADLDGVIN